MVSKAGPSHPEPGKLHVLDLDLRAGPQVTRQGVHASHSDHVPVIPDLTLFDLHVFPVFYIETSN